jgi:hypothetical protein
MRYGGSNPPLCTISFEVVSGERCGSEPCRQRKNVDRAVRAWFVSGFSLADDAAGQTEVADLDTVRVFCLSCHTRTAAFAVGLKSKKF